MDKEFLQGRKSLIDAEETMSKDRATDLLREVLYFCLEELDPFEFTSKEWAYEVFGIEEEEYNELKDDRILW